MRPTHGTASQQGVQAISLETKINKPPIYNVLYKHTKHVSRGGFFDLNVRSVRKVIPLLLKIVGLSSIRRFEVFDSEMERIRKKYYL